MGLKFEICTPYGSIEILYFSKAIQFFLQIGTLVHWKLLLCYVIVISWGALWSLARGDVWNTLITTNKHTRVSWLRKQWFNSSAICLTFGKISLILKGLERDTSFKMSTISCLDPKLNAKKYISLTPGLNKAKLDELAHLYEVWGRGEAFCIL